MLQPVPLVSSLLQGCETPCTSVIYMYISSLICLVSIAPAIADNNALHSPIHIFCSVCTTYVISAFQRLYEFSGKHFLSHQEGLLFLNIFAFLFLPFYTSLFTVFIGEFSIFYLTVLRLWFLLCLSLYPSLSILSTIRHFKFLKCALHHFLCIGAFYTCPCFGRSISSILLRNRSEQRKRLYSNWGGTEYLWPLLRLFVFVFLIDASFWGIWFCPPREEISANWEKGIPLLSDHNTALQVC